MVIKFLILNYFLIRFIFPSIIIPLTQTDYQLFLVNICIGTPIQCGDYILSFSENGLKLFGSSTFVSYNSSTIKYLEDSMFSETCEDVVLVGGITLPDLQFQIISSSLRNLGIFGLGQDSKKNSHILIHNLFNKVYLKNFYINVHKKELIIGEENIKYKKYCSLSPLYSKKYHCKFDSVYFKEDNNRYYYSQIQDYISFCPSANSIYAPRTFVEDIFSHFLKKLVDKKICHTNDENGFLFATCNKDYDFINDNSLPLITFIVGHFSLQIEAKDLFDLINGELYFKIAHNENRSGWEFGYPFLKRYKTVIDVENNKIGFIKNE